MLQISLCLNIYLSVSMTFLTRIFAGEEHRVNTEEELLNLMLPGANKGERIGDLNGKMQNQEKKQPTRTCLRCECM